MTNPEFEDVYKQFIARVDELKEDPSQHDAQEVKTIRLGQLDVPYKSGAGPEVPCE